IVRNLDPRLLWIFAFAAGIACLAMSGSFMNERKLFWGAKYGVFPLDLSVVETLVWYGRQTRLLMTQPAALHGFDPAVQCYLRHIFFAAYVLGVAALVHRRRYAELGLLVSLLAFSLLANALGYWPYGDFRTNLFLLPAALLV